MTMICPLPGSVEDYRVEDETGPCNGVKGAVDVYDPPLEARVPRLDRCCLKQKVGYSRDTAPKKTIVGNTGGTALAHGDPPKVIRISFPDTLSIRTRIEACFFEKVALSACPDFFDLCVFPLGSAWKITF